MTLTDDGMQFKFNSRGTHRHTVTIAECLKKKVVQLLCNRTNDSRYCILYLYVK